MSKPEVKIEDWIVIGDKLYGNAIDHPRFDKGTPVVTSSIVQEPLLPKEGDTIETRNTIYRLVGQKAEYPNV